jgi:hypothetical protein
VCICWGVAPLILNLFTTWKWQARFIPQQLLYSWEKVSITHLVGGWWALELVWMLYGREYFTRVGHETRDFLLIQPVAKKHYELTCLCSKYIDCMISLNNGDRLCSKFGCFSEHSGWWDTG